MEGHMPGAGAWLWPSWQLLKADPQLAGFYGVKEESGLELGWWLLCVQAEERHRPPFGTTGKIEFDCKGRQHGAQKGGAGLIPH